MVPCESTETSNPSSEVYYMAPGRLTGLLTTMALVCFLLLSACASISPTRSRVPVPPGTSPEIRSPDRSIDPSSVEKRIDYLKSIIDDEDRVPDAEHSTLARALLKDYRRILEQLRSPASSPGEPSTEEILFERLGIIEARFFEAGPLKTTALLPMVVVSVQKEERVFDAYGSGDYAGVIRVCRDLENTYGPEVLSPEASVLLAVSLAETGKTREAVRLGERLLPELKDRPGLFNLRGRMVDWHLRQGNSMRAREHYHQLLDDMQKRGVILETAARALEPAAASISPDLRDQTPTEKLGDEYSGPFGDLLHRVDTLIQARAFDQARLLLVRQRIRYPEGAETAAIDQAMDRVDRAEAVHQTRTPDWPPLQPQVSEALEEAEGLMEAEEYESALAGLEVLQDSLHEADPRVENLRQKAESELVRSNRERAAKLFLMARNARNTEEKADHLRASQGLLRKLLDRFPDSALAPTIRSNLDTVEEEMERMGLPQ